MRHTYWDTAHEYINLNTIQCSQGDLSNNFFISQFKRARSQYSWGQGSVCLYEIVDKIPPSKSSSPQTPMSGKTYEQLLQLLILKTNAKNKKTRIYAQG